MNVNTYTYLIEIDLSNDNQIKIVNDEVNTEELLDLVLRCKYNSITIYGKKKHEVNTNVRNR